MKLGELQSAFQAAIIAGDETEAQVVNQIVPKEDESRETLFGVYVHAYLLRHGDYLEEDYPALRGYLGDRSFRSLIKAYVAAHPSRNRSARWFTTRLPDFLRESARWRANARAIGLAELERALTDAFDAADAPAEDIGALARRAPEEWPRLCFSFSPSLHVLQVAAGTLDAYAVATDETIDAKKKAIKPPADDRLEAVAVWRSNLELAYRGLEDDEHLALQEARAGKSFGDICQLVAFQKAEQPAEERLAQFLVNWFSEGMVSAVTVAD
ncbi:MAG TPA: DNA-binding domain-containing protein [Methylocystis sp.]|nr:DNA-binding domain-containing protein [Methylocystis sp.]